MMNSQYYIYIIVLLSTVLIYTEGELYCFKKIHSAGDVKRGAICRGMINKTTSSGSKRPFRSPKGCCRGGGRGYYDEAPLERFGKKGLKYKCTLCTHILPPKTKTTTPATTTTRIGWSEWGTWGECSKTCSAGVQRRQRLCDVECGDGEAAEQLPCMVRSDCPVNGGWGPWRDWTGCSVTCGSGNKTRTRRCNNPKPRYNGLKCQGDEEQAAPCSEAPCPVHGNWGEWSEAVCSATCGNGMIERKRECNNPAPSHNGSECEGQGILKSSCSALPKCPIDGGWSLWGDWSACTATCGNGTIVRDRKCVAPKPRHRGAPCEGEDVEYSTCYHPIPCAVDGGWTEWNTWAQCLATPCTGDRGYTTRARTCSNPLPQYNGTLCTGNTTETQECENNFNCLVNGSWCAWSEYSECRVSNQLTFKTKTRQCACPAPQNGGVLCTGIDYESVNCLTDEKLPVVRCADVVIHIYDDEIDNENNIDASGFSDDEDTIFEDCL